MTHIKRDKKALIKDLELQIDHLVGYAPTSQHWKREYYFRKELIDMTLAADETPKEIRDKINRIQDSIYRMQNNEEIEQGYLVYSMQDYIIKHDIKINNFSLPSGDHEYAVLDENMDKREVTPEMRFSWYLQSHGL